MFNRFPVPIHVKWQMVQAGKYIVDKEAIRKGLHPIDVSELGQADGPSCAVDKELRKKGDIPHPGDLEVCLGSLVYERLTVYGEGILA